MHGDGRMSNSHKILHVLNILFARVIQARVHSMHVLWKIFGVSFELLAHNHVEVGAQVFSFGGWRSIKCLSETLSINNRLVIGLASIIL
jgi:hypothetical protein